MKTSKITKAFDAAAAKYDEAAAIQEKIAVYLVEWSAAAMARPVSALDVGSGTGLVAAALHERWPDAAITAMDSSVSMLREARRKFPQLSILQGDAQTAAIDQKFDAIFSSMALHWLPDPAGALRKWQGWLKPGGKLFVALPFEGSFHEWKNLCRRNGVEDGLWILPPGDFAGDRALRTMHKDFVQHFPAALDFLQSIKSTGAATARPGHSPVRTSAMRRILNASPRPMPATYRIAFLELPASDP